MEATNSSLLKSGTKEEHGSNHHQPRHLDVKNPKQASVIDLLMDASKRDDVGIVQSLVMESHISPDSVDRKGWSALLRASKSGSLKVLHFLLEYKANINAQTKEGNAALHKAAKRNHPEVAKILINHKADIDLGNKGGVTPLMLSVMHHRSTSVFEAILAGRPDVDMQKDVGYSALMLAARMGNGLAVHELLKAKANPELKDKQGETAYVKAAKHRREEVAELLLQHGAIAHSLHERNHSRISQNSDHHGSHHGTHRSHDTGHQVEKGSGHSKSSLAKR